MIKVFCDNFVRPDHFNYSKSDKTILHNSKTYVYLGYTKKNLSCSEKVKRYIILICKIALTSISAGLFLISQNYRSWIQRSIRTLHADKIKYYKLSIQLAALPPLQGPEKGSENSFVTKTMKSGIYINELLHHLKTTAGVHQGFIGLVSEFLASNKYRKPNSLIEYYKCLDRLEAIQKEFNDPKLTHKIFQENRKLVERSFSLEAIKVRTFALELLSNIEELLNPRRELVECIASFLSSGAIECNAGFNDYKQLLAILETATEQLEDPKPITQILEKHKTLLDLQKKFPKKKITLEKQNYWSKIRTLVRSGLFVSTILQTAEHARKIGLQPIPPLPEQSTHFNLYSIVDTINLTTSERREAGRWLFHNIKILSFRDLCQSIKNSCEALRKKILSFDEYSLMTIKGKSQEWVANLAYRYLPIEKQPNEIIEIGNERTQGDEIFDSLVTAKGNNFILFDDASYSGTQLVRYLDKLKGDLIDKNHHFEKTKNLIIVYGFSTSSIDWDGVIQHMEFEKYNVKVEFICANRFDQIPAQIKSLPDYLPRHLTDICNNIKKSLCVTQWKTPDYVSTPMYVTTGYHYNSLRYNLPGFDAMAKHRLFTIDPITDVKAPYKMSK